MMLLFAESEVIVILNFIGNILDRYGLAVAELVVIGYVCWKWGKPMIERVVRRHLILVRKLGKAIDKIGKAQDNIDVTQKQVAVDQRRHSDDMKTLVSCQEKILTATNETNRILGNGHCKADPEKTKAIHDMLLELRKQGKPLPKG